MQPEKVKLNRISKKRPFSYHLDDVRAELIRSFENNGILSPVWLIEKDELLLIDGNRRLVAAKKMGMEYIPALIYGNEPFDEIFFSALLLNSSNQLLSAIERLKVVEILNEQRLIHFEEKILKSLDLFYVNNIKEVSTAISKLPLEFQKYLHKKNVPTRKLQLLLRYPYLIYLLWYNLALDLSMSFNDFLIILENISEICQRDSCTPQKVWETIRAQKIISSEKTSQQKIKSIKLNIEQLRFPILDQVNNEMKHISDKITKSINGKLNISWDSTLENQHLSFNFDVKEYDDIGMIVEFFSDTNIKGLLKELIDRRSRSLNIY